MLNSVYLIQFISLSIVCYCPSPTPSSGDIVHIDIVQKMHYKIGIKLELHPQYKSRTLTLHVGIFVTDESLKSQIIDIIILQR